MAKQVIDPVCGMTVAPEKTSHKSEYKRLRPRVRRRSPFGSLDPAGQADR